MHEHESETRPRGEESCPACGAPAERGQLVCLECGARIALDYRRPAGWKLPLAIVSAVLAVAIAALVLALTEIDDEAKSEVARAPARPSAGASGSARRRDEPRGRASGGERDGEAEKKRRGGRERRSGGASRAGAGWPEGRNAFTVVLASTEDRGSARALARNVRQRGLPAGVLRSTDYSSLEPGFWMVFSGVYRTRAQAERRAARLSRAFPGAFPQFVNGAERRRRR